ncbi:hypothetical protein WJX82_011321 [Trebouxia sp. C0006]
MPAHDLKAVTGSVDHVESNSTPSKLGQDMEAMLSPKATLLNEMLAESPTAEGRLEATLSKIGMLEDMDVQLRSQLEKIIVQRNQLGAEKAARDIEIQHLRAQVELLEADSAGRHDSDSRPGSPRESESDRIVSHVESLQADNARLQLQVEISGHAASDLQQQLHDSQQQLQSKSHNAVPSLAVSLESQLRAQVSKNAQITAASQGNRISQLFSSLTDSNASMADAKQRSSQLEEELAVSRELSAEQKAEVGELKAQLSEQAAKVAAESASRTEADAGLHAQLKAESAKHKEDQGAWQEEVNGLQALAANAQKQKESLQTEVQMLQNKQEEHQKLLAEQETQLQVLGAELKSQTDARTASEQQLQEMKDRHQLEQQTQQVQNLTEQLNAQKQLQQQLGERTIVLGQKAHQIALLTAQLNEARSPSFDEASQGEHSILNQGKQLRSTQNSVRPSTLEAQFMKSSRGSSAHLSSGSTQQQPQLRPAVAKPESDSEAFSDQLDPQLSPPQSRPESQSAEGTSDDGLELEGI